MQRDELHLCISTLRDDLFSITPDDFESAIDACEAAGLDGISLWTLHHMLLEGAGYSGDDIKRELDARGLRVSCIEAIAGWANVATAEAAVADAEPSIEIAEFYGATNLVAVTMDPELASFDQTVANLAAIADRAAESNVSVCIEYLPWSGIPDVVTCAELLRRTERDNVGFTFDSWHWQRQPGGPGGANAEALAAVPGEQIRIFQLCDVQAEPAEDMMAEAMESRPLPGDGIVDHEALFEIFRDIGADPVVSPEVFNTELRSAGSGPFVTRIADASRAVLGAW